MSNTPILLQAPHFMDEAVRAISQKNQKILPLPTGTFPCAVCCDLFSCLDVMEHPCVGSRSVTLENGVFYPSQDEIQTVDVQDEDTDDADQVLDDNEPDPESDSKTKPYMMRFWNSSVPLNPEGKFEDITELLIRVVHSPEHYQRLRDKKTRKDKVWREVAASMKKYGVVFPNLSVAYCPGLKCKDKYNNLLKAYAKYVRMRGSAAGAPKKKQPKHFDLLDSFLRNNQEVTPMISDALSPDAEGEGETYVLSSAPSTSSGSCVETQKVLSYLKQRDVILEKRAKNLSDIIKNAYDRELAIREKELALREKEVSQREALIQLLKNGNK